MNYPILMADIKKSSEQNPKLLMKRFQKLVFSINETHHKNILSPLTITLGDEFQGIIDTLENGVKIIYEIEEFVIQEELDIKLRYVLNFGKIETKINNQIAYEMLGEGLTEARNILNNLKKEDSRFLIQTGKKNQKDYYINQAFTVYQSIVDDWKSKDLKIVSEFLHYGDYKKVAEIIKTDTSSAWRRKRSLKINEYLSSKEIILYLLKK